MGLVKVGGSVTACDDVYIIMPDSRPGFGYEVEKDLCDTPERILKWVYQLSCKDWIDAGLISLFINAVCHDLGISLSI
jgi:hypothetical protein